MNTETLTDVATEGVWLWADGTTFWEHGMVEGKFSNWLAEQPNNNGAEGAENCVVLLSSDEGRWNDLACDIADFRVVCETAGPVLPPLP